MLSRTTVASTRTVSWPLGCLVVLLCSLLTSCAGPASVRDPDPLDALLAWTRALEENRPRDAWVLLAPSAREGLEEGEFVALFASRRADLVERAQRLLDWARTHPPAERAEVVVGEQRFRLVRTRGGWRIDGVSGGARETSSKESPSDRQ